MTGAEIQAQMGPLFESLRTLEVQIQTVSGDLAKSTATEEATSAGVDEVKAKLAALKRQDTVPIVDFVAVRKDVETLERFLEQAKANKAVTAATLKFLTAQQTQLQQTYELMARRLVESDKNVLAFAKNVTEQ